MSFGVAVILMVAFLSSSANVVAKYTAKHAIEAGFLPVMISIVMMLLQIWFAVFKIFMEMFNLLQALSESVWALIY